MSSYLKTSFCTLLWLALPLADALAASDLPTIGSPSDKLFGSNVFYSATMELQTDKGKPVVTKVFVDQGMVRHEMDMLSQLPPALTGAMGNSSMKMVLLYLPGKGFYQIQTTTRGYLELPFANGKPLTPADYKLELTEVGKETLNGQACVKNKAVVTDPQNRRREFLVWNATALNNFPIKIQTTTSLGESQTTIYRNVSLTRPDPKLFELPAGYRKYADISAMMQDIMMKQMSGGI